MKDRLTLFTKYLLDVLFYAGIVVTVTLPLCIDTFAGAAKDV